MWDTAHRVGRRDRKQRNASTVSSYAHQYASVGGRYCQQHPSTVALHSTEALMAGFLKSSDLGPHPHGYGTAHHPHHAHPHGPLPPGMPMTSLAPFGLPHGLDAVGFPQASVWINSHSQDRIPLRIPSLSSLFLLTPYGVVFRLMDLEMDNNKI
uniref:Uncharacterized protein n=1 Tax=Anopheles culicifacies TaxID=139723 RepID=A0A182MAJ1_9DIPT